MTPRWFVSCAVLLLTALVGRAAESAKPNIIFILADDLGYGELGSYGQTLAQTPNLDRMAAEGMKFTQFYAGSTVCAPSRSVLMTGKHMGHTTVRGNAGLNNMSAQTLRPTDVTVAKVLKDAGYATGLIGKWGLGSESDDGAPQKHGFDYYFGYLNQTHAHNHYPDFLWRNGEKVPLPNDLTPLGNAPGAGYSTNRKVYADDLFAEDARAFVEKNRNQPFFLFYAMVTPHANNERSKALGDGNEVPDLGIYADKPWNDSQKAHAAMITRMDRDVGDLLAQLKKLGLEEKTLVIFSSDNGPHKEGGPNYDPAFFRASGPFSGNKRTLTDGGIRVPFLARWPGTIKAGQVSPHIGYFGDLMATFSELAGAKAPANLDSLSFARALRGRWLQPQHKFLYWEFYEGGNKQAVLMEDGRWKAIRTNGPGGPVQLFDLKTDIAEKTDLAAQDPKRVAQANALMDSSHVPNEHWKIVPGVEPATRKKQQKKAAEEAP